MKKSEVIERSFVLDGYNNFDGSRLNSFVLFSTKGLRCKTDKTIFKHTFTRSVCEKEIELELTLKTFRDCDTTYVLTAEFGNSAKVVRKSLILEGAGSDLTTLLAKLAMDLAEGFCDANKLKVCSRFSHSPVLEYLVQEDPILMMHGK